MNLISTPNLPELLSRQNLLIDTCTLIDASKCSAVYDFLAQLQSSSCTFISIPEVKAEFTRSASTAEEYLDLSKFIESLNVLFLQKTQDHFPLTDNIIFNIALGRCKNIRPSFVDRKLLSIPYHYRNSPETIHLITSNHKDIPSEFFDRIGFITHDIGGFHNIGIYTFNSANFKKIAQHIQLPSPLP